jgi:ketosteroid isomerase-like protein
MVAPQAHGEAWQAIIAVIDLPYDELIADLTAAFNEHDIDRAFRWMREDVVYDFSRSMGDNRGVHRGFDSLRNVWTSFLQPWESVNWQVSEIEELDEDRVLIGTEITVRGRGSGIETEAHGAQVLEFRDGKLARATMFQSPAQARKAFAAGELGPKEGS